MQVLSTLLLKVKAVHFFCQWCLFSKMDLKLLLMRRGGYQQLILRTWEDVLCAKNVIARTAKNISSLCLNYLQRLQLNGSHFYHVLLLPSFISNTFTAAPGLSSWQGIWPMSRNLIYWRTYSIPFISVSSTRALTCSFWRFLTLVLLKKHHQWWY